MVAVDTEKVKVLFIGGAGRSGTTLLDLILGQVEGFFAVGELRHIWDRGLKENQLCGCGQKFKECDFWGNVVKEAFGSFQDVDIEGIRELWLSVDHGRYIPHLASPWRVGGYEERLIAYSQILSKLYRAIHKVSGGKVIVDSSKKPSHGFILNALPDIELYIIHLIRDSRGVAFSWSKEKLRPEIHWKKEYTPLFKPAHSALSWNARNILTHMLMYVNKHYSQLRYEDLVSDPQGVSSRASAHVREQIPFVEHLDRLKVDLRLNHTISGNPMRFQQGVVGIRPDIEWQEKMDKRQKILVTALTWPFLLRYGYLRENNL